MDIGFNDYIPPSYFGSEVEIFILLADGTELPLEEAKAAGVASRTVVLRPTETILLNQGYTVVVDGVTGKSAPASAAAVHRFSSEFSPLYAKPQEMRPVLQGLIRYFTAYQLYVALRDAGQKAHQLLGLIIDPNNSRYRAIGDRDTAYYPAQKYVVYEAAYTLLSALLVGLADQYNVGSPTESVETGESITLGDFSVSPKSGSSGSSGSEAPSVGSMLNLIRATLSAVDADRKFWRDALMGRNARGYATPVTTSSRIAAGSPEDRSF